MDVHTLISGVANFVILTFLLLSHSQICFAVRPLCSDKIVDLQASHPSILLRPERHFGDGFTPRRHIENFWSKHKEFGFLRSNDRIILIARNKEISSTIISELKSLLTNPFLQETEIEFHEIPGGVKFDVTDVVPHIVRTYLDIYPANNGPNCWNLCLLNSGIAGGFREVSADEFKHWLGSPFSKRVLRIRDLRPDDVIALRKGRNEVHGMI